MTLPANWITGSAFTASAENAVEAAVNALQNTGVIVVAAPTGVAATDTANIQAAINAVPSTGGDVVLQAGKYALSSSGVTISSPVRLMGIGGTGSVITPVTGGSTGGWIQTGAQCSWICATSATTTAITVTANSASFENFVLSINASVTPTAGYGIQCTGSSGVLLDRMVIENFWNGANFYNCDVFTASDSFFVNNKNIGIYIDWQNPFGQDQGDNQILGCRFWGYAYTEASAVYLATIGGFRMMGCKINGTFTTGIEVSLSTGGATNSDFFIQNNSIETNNKTGTGLAFVTNNGEGVNIMVTGNQFANWATAVSVNSYYTVGIITDNIILNCTNGVYFNSTAGWTLGTNTFSSTTNPIVGVSSSSTDILTAPQHYTGFVWGLPSQTPYVLYPNPIIVTAPSTATSTGTAGQVAYDSTYFYVCVATNTWVRAALATF